MRGGGSPTAAQKYLPTFLLGHWLSHEAPHPALPSCVGTMCACHGSAQNGRVSVSGLGPTLRISTLTKLHNPRLAPACACVSVSVPIPFLVLTLGGGKPHTAGCLLTLPGIASVSSCRQASLPQKAAEGRPTAYVHPLVCSSLHLRRCGHTPVYIVYSMRRERPVCV